MVHACSIDYIKKDSQLIKYIHCMIEDNYDPKEIGRTVKNSSSSRPENGFLKLGLGSLVCGDA